MYLTYLEYKDMGGTVDKTAFNQLEFEARAKIDWYTFNRLQKETEFPEAVKRCMYKLISLIQNAEQASVVGGTSADGSITAGVASQSNDGVSISFNTLSAKDMIDVSDKEIEDCINTYLQSVINSLGQKVLYRGIYPNE